MSEGERKAAEMKIPEPLAHFPKQTAIYKLFNKKYWKGRVICFDPKTDQYTVQYDDDNEEELTHNKVKAYLIPPVQGEYWTAQQSGRRQSKRIEKVSFTGGYTGAVRALSHTPTWSELNKQSEQEYKHFANTVIDEETGRQLEYRHLIEHPKFKDDWLKSGANEFYRLFQGSKAY